MMKAENKIGWVFQKRLIFILFVLLLPVVWSCSSPDPVRLSFSLNNDWETFASDSMGFVLDDFQNEDFDSFDWIKVDVPHNWDDYGGYRRLVHGNFHGTAWYRKYFRIEKPQGDKRFFLFFEGVGSYATVWLNGDSIGYHAGGRTTFTLDVTQAIRFDKENILAVRADHPAFIKDLPWVCGGCSSDLGFSEGSQPLGIFRPVHLVVTNQVRVEPFGVHIFNNEEVSEGKATLQLSVEIKNYGNEARELIVENLLKDHKGKTVVQNSESVLVEPGWIDTLSSSLPEITNPRLWSLPDPYLYQLHTQIWEKGQLIDELISPYGIRSTRWDINSGDSVNRFFLNGKPVFINGSAEYEHLMGQSHAFSPEQIRARLAQFKAMGYNAFRDAHQPHNLLYQHLCDSLGILWWPQFSAHVWFDNPDFRTNFQQLMHDWIKERRNSPSIILWGLQNESILPDSFSLECTELVRKLDPGSPFQRLVATCNGGAGTDWNVPQNWSGTYGGNPNNYGRELIDQKMNAEYGAWRSIDHHTEGGFVQNGPLSEERIGLLMETKILQAESVRDSVCGHFHWPFISHDNPGRRQGGEGTRELDRVGPVNYKGTLTIWGEPTDLFYLYRSNYCPAEKEPMVYIVSHTWPDRWTEPGIKNNISIFSNCDEVELYNGFKENWLGKQSRGASGSRFIFDSVDVQYNVLYAVAYLKGKKVTTDIVRLNHLPEAPGLKKWAGKTKALTSSDCHYLYRVNCGGPDYTDKQGNLWMADVPYSKEGTWGSLSWADDYPGVPSFFGSQRQTYDPIKGTLDWPLIQTFRYGKHKLRYQFPVPDDTYCVELFFTEPWYGTGGGMNCKNWRLFDVAVNGETVISDLDIWSEAGHDRVLKKEYLVEVKGGMLEISFPKVKSGQAVISAIAISGFESDAKPAPSSPRLIGELKASEGIWESATVKSKKQRSAFGYLYHEPTGRAFCRNPCFNRIKTPVVKFIRGHSKTDYYYPEWLNPISGLQETDFCRGKGIFMGSRQSRRNCALPGCRGAGIDTRRHYRSQAFAYLSNRRWGKTGQCPTT